VITAVDSSVLIDVLTAHPVHGRASAEALRRARGLGTLIACPVVWAEVSSWYGSDERVRADLDAAGVEYSDITLQTAVHAGQAWGRYRAAGGSRTRIIADFLIGAHAVVQADALLTRDRGFHRRYFASLDVLDPATRSR
jgi:hypothetical protein